MKNSIIATEQISSHIYLVKNQKVILDSDLAVLYGVQTKVLNQAVKRNIQRFPKDFMFQLTNDEWTKLSLEKESLGSQNVTLNKRGGHRKYLPYVFTEHGAVMLASILKSDQAINASILVVRAFVRIREYLLDHKELAQKIETLETNYDQKFSQVFEVIKQLIHQKNEPRKSIGFKKSKE